MTSPDRYAHIDKAAVDAALWDTDRFTTTTVAEVITAGSDRPFCDWLRVQHTRGDSTGDAAKWFRTLPASWDLQLESIFQTVDACDVTGGPTWALDDAIDEYRGYLSTLGLHQAPNAATPVPAEAAEAIG